MKPHHVCALLGALILSAAPVGAMASDFAFGVIGQTIVTPNDSAPLAQAIMESDADNLAFVVADGFKRADESCSDDFYQQRYNVLANAKNGLILALAAGDWSECKTAAGRADGIERLNRLRELFFSDEFSLGASKIPLLRQSITPKFRSYTENARWEVGNIVFTAFNLPAGNNRYRTEAGRNSEFEDRAIATREWLRRTFNTAALRKSAGIVLICDGDPFVKNGQARLFESNARRDGYAEVRQQLTTLAAKFPGKVLLIHNRTDTKALHTDKITWRGNMGELEVDAGWVKVSVRTGTPALFTAKPGDTQSPMQPQ
ncbi:MAG TPA: hypothetical protein VIF60_21490 [Burkholderiaceae bacterium]|jgi:hypothetical protein